VNIATVIGFDKSKAGFAGAHIALGSVAPNVMRTKEAEELLRGKAIDFYNINAGAAIVEKTVKPITDIRASVEYRKR
jgi:CO/xanthine dehydrogenase FAD-binding subunit